jgi:hypothetical protein
MLGGGESLRFLSRSSRGLDEAVGNDGAAGEGGLFERSKLDGDAGFDSALTGGPESPERMLLIDMGLARGGGCCDLGGT